MFCDEALIELKAGRGGDGLVSFRHSRLKAKGGPNGGDGGKGGDVYFRVNRNLNTLSSFLSKKFFHAEDGENGKRENCRGRSGEDLIIDVPYGTLIFDTSKDEPILDMTDQEEPVCLLKGGRGGFGNAHFTSSRRQTPKFAEKGEMGEEIMIKLELKLVAEVGIIGYPSVGKSTLISVISNAKPKIAEYEFTTLVPNLGVVKGNDYEFVVCDIPGLIDGASAGKGLGHKFLRHIERCLILIHIVDVLKDGVSERLKAINHELEIFNPKLIQKPQIIALNKVDAIDEKTLQSYIKELKKHSTSEVFAISAATGGGVEALMHETAKHLRQLRLEQPEQEPEEERVTFTPHLEESFESKDYRIFEKDGMWFVEGKRIEQIANMTDWSNIEAMGRFYDILKKLGISKKLVSFGVKTGEMIYIGSKPVEFVEPLQ